MDNPTGISISNSGALFVADIGRGRVLAWNTFPTRNNQPADFAIGTDNHSLDTPGGNFTPCLQLPYPLQVSVSGNRLMVTNDPLTGPANYAYFYDPPPTKVGFCTSFFSVSAGAMASGTTFKRGGPLIAGGRFFMLDSGYNRLLIWSSVPTDNTITDATGVFGQMDLISSGANRGAAPDSSTLSAPAGVPASDGTRLLVADTGNHRALLWNALPTGSGSVASFPLGQATFSQNSKNRGGVKPSASTLNGPQAVAMSGSQIAVADTGNHRVLLWNQSIASMGQSADVVLGRADFADGSDPAPSASASTMNTPRGIATDGTRLVVSDTLNHRILIWTAWPTRNAQEADLILGQPTPTGGTSGGRVPSDANFVEPVAVARAGKQYLVVDAEASRVLLYPAPPTSPLDRPSVVLGQPDLTSGKVNNQGPSAATLNHPQSVSSDGNILAVADTDNHRVLIWRSLPTDNMQPADLILGQDLASSITANAGTSQRGLNRPRGVHVAGGKIYVADTDNHRVLIWNSIPTGRQAMADVVLGQDSLLAVSGNRGGTAPTAQTLSAPTAVITDGNAIYVSDSGANRVLVYSTLEPATGQAADVVLGQVRFDVGMAGAVSERSLKFPIGLSIYRSKLYVADSGYHRIVYYDLPSLSSGALAVGVIGQSILSNGDPNRGGLSLAGLSSPSGILVSESGVYIADRANGRVVAQPPGS